MSARASTLLTAVAVPCLSFGPVFIAIGFANQSVLDHLCLDAGAVMVGGGLAALFAMVARVERRLAQLEEKSQR